MKQFILITLLATHISSHGVACYINKPMYQEITRFSLNASEIRHAAGEFSAQTMDFYVTFRGVLDGKEKLYVGLITFHQLNCSVIKSEFHETEPWQPGP